MGQPYDTGMTSCLYEDNFIYFIPITCLSGIYNLITKRFVSLLLDSSILDFIHENQINKERKEKEISKDKKN